MSEAAQKEIDNKGFTSDSKCGNCYTEFPIAVYSEGCPACDSGAIQTFLTKNIRVGVVGMGAPLPVSLWEKRVLSGVRYAAPAYPKNLSGPIDNKGFTPDSKCGNCKAVFAVAVCPDGCPVCNSKSIQTFSFDGPEKKIDGVGGLPKSLWEQRLRWGVEYVAPVPEKKSKKDIYNLTGGLINSKTKSPSNGRRLRANSRLRKLKSKIHRRLKLRAN